MYTWHLGTIDTQYENRLLSFNAVKFMMPITFHFKVLKLFAVRNKMIWKEFFFGLRKRFYRTVRGIFLSQSKGDSTASISIKVLSRSSLPSFGPSFL